MEIREIVYQSYAARPYAHAQSRVSWGAVFAGALMTMAVFLSLAMLGAGIGLGGASGAFAAGYAFVSALASYYAGGWFAGRLAANGHVADSVIHGALSWSVCALLSAYLVGSGLGTFVNLAGLFGRGAPAGPLTLETFRVVGVLGSVLMFVELAVCCYGARMGTRVYRYQAAPPVGQTRERELSGV